MNWISQLVKKGLDLVEVGKICFSFFFFSFFCRKATLEILCSLQSCDRHYCTSQIICIFFQILQHNLIIQYKFTLLLSLHSISKCKFSFGMQITVTTLEKQRKQFFQLLLWIEFLVRLREFEFSLSLSTCFHKRISTGPFFMTYSLTV